ncbi:MAG: DedA family protein [Bacilli bacterium]|jgi:membrane-associated protein|nr:DedA family protein [Bacilli bacterium]
MGMLIDFIIHFDKHLIELINNYGSLTYIILFLIIFCETGLVVTPILPGDSLLFVSGAIAAMGGLNIVVLYFVLLIAAVLGDACNYTIGKFLGHKIGDNNRFIKKEHLDKTREFFKKHGPKTIVLARFVPIVRTFAPFLAGSSDMSYHKFFSYNVLGAIGWVTLFVLAGYFFGNIPIVKNNITLLGLGIVVVSLLPIIFIKIKSMLSNKK